jgi:hypothetical protein
MAIHVLYAWICSYFGDDEGSYLHDLEDARPRGGVRSSRNRNMRDELTSAPGKGTRSQSAGSPRILGH